MTARRSLGRVKFLLQWFINVFLHLDVFLPYYFNQYGAIVYLLLFIIIFCETGLVVAPFLPGDSLIFAAGAVAALGESNIILLFLVLLCAAVFGNIVNYAIGRLIGQKLYEKEKHRFIKKENIDSAMAFFEKRGGITIIITRFMPIIRTFTPFVAGIAKMPRHTFILYNFSGGFLWVTFFLAAGYIFGQQPFVKSHISMIMIGIIVISLLPAIITRLVAMYKARKPKRS